jgi:cytochrome c553
MRVAARHGTTWAAAGLFVIALGGAIAAQGRGTGQSRPPQTPAGRGSAPRTAQGADQREAIARRICSQCHPFEFVVGVSRTRAQWEAVVENMVGRGARGTSAELSAVIDYLAENHVLTPSNVRGGSGPDDKPIVDPKAAQDAKPLWSANCIACHGADARGTDKGPNLVRSLVVLKDRYGSTLGPYLRANHPPVPAPVPAPGAKKGTAPSATAFEGLSNRDVLLLAHFLRERINDTLRGAPMFKPGNVLTGDAKAGQDYFNGAGGCTKCHSPSGDLAGIGRRLEPVNIQQRFLFPHTVRRADAKVVTVTVTTESGETIAGPLERMDDFYVSLRDANGIYRTVRRTPGTRVVKTDPFEAHVALLSRITDQNIHDVVAYLESLK